MVVPGLVICRWCNDLGPDVPERWIHQSEWWNRLPDELEAEALIEGWHFEAEVDDWICPGCIVRRSNAAAN